MMDLLAHDKRTTDYLDDVLKTSVTSAMRSCVSSKPSNGIGFIVDHLNANNSNRSYAKATVRLQTVEYTLTRSRLEVPALRQYLHPKLPVIGDQDATRDEVYKLINTIRDTHTNRLAERAAEETIDSRSKSVQGVTSADLTPAPVTKPTRIKLLVIAPVNKEVIFIGNQPMIGSVAENRAKDRNDTARSPRMQRQLSGNSMREYSDIEQTGSDGDSSSSEQSLPLGDTVPDGTVPLRDMGIPHAKKTTYSADIEEALAQSAMDQGVASTASKQGAMPLRQLGDYVSKVFSTSGITIESCVIRLADRYRISTDVFERIDEFVGISDAAEIVPTVVVTYGLRPFIFRNVLSILVTAMTPLQEVANFKHNEILLRKRAVETKAREQRNEWRLVNAAAYWTQVRSRRELRDKQREQLALEVTKRQPQPPLPSNATEEERVAHEEKRRLQDQARAQAEAAFEENTHKARIVRQARRSREDVLAAEVMNKQANASGIIIQSVLRGYLVRRKIREKLALLRAQKLGETLNSSVRSQRRTKRPGKVDEVDRLAEIKYVAERHIVDSMMNAFSELLTLKPPPVPRPPRSYVSWIPKKKRIPPPFDADVSSEDEDWEKEIIFVAPTLPTTRFRLMNPMDRLLTVFRETGNDLVRYVDEIATQFGNSSPLQRQAYFALQTKVHHLLHVVYLELTHREMISPDAGGFTQFVQNHFPQLDSWFVSPLAVLDTLSNTPQPTAVSAGAQAHMIDRNSYVCYDSGSFDVRAVYHPVVQTSTIPGSPKFASETPNLDRAASMVATVHAQQHVLPHDVVTHQQQQQHVDDNGTITPVREVSPTRASREVSAEGSPVVRIRQTGLYCTADGISLDHVRSSLTNISRTGAKRLLWLQCTPEPMVYVDRKPFFLSRRWEQQSLPGRPSYLDFSAMTNVIPTNADGTPIGDKLSSPGRRRSFGNKSPSTVPNTAFSTSHARQIAGAMPAAAMSVTSVSSTSKVPFTPQAVSDEADRVSAEFRGVSWLEQEERLRAEVLTAVDRTEGVFSFFVHQSVFASQFVVAHANGPHALFNDAYRLQVDAQLLPPASVSARGPHADTLEEHSVVIALPKKEAPIRNSIATSRSSMFVAPDQSIAMASSRDMRGLSNGENSQTPRALGSHKSTAASKSIRLSVASKSDSSEPHGDGTAHEQGRGSLSLAPAPTLPDTDALPMLIQSPIGAFDELLLVAAFAERKFSRFPLININGMEWLARVSHLSKLAFTHLRDTTEANALVLSIPDESALIYAAFIEVINVILIERAHVHTTTPQQSPTTAGAPVDPVFASLRIAPGSRSLHGSETTSSKPSKPPRTEPDRVFGSILGLDVSEPELGLRKALRALDSILPAAGLAIVRDRVISLRKRAEASRGTPECRALVRECCCALEHYIWLVYFTSLALQAAADGSFSVPDLYDSVIQTAGGESIERLVLTLDPWSTSPRCSPDPFHVSLYSQGAERWKQLHFVPRVQ